MTIKYPAQYQSLHQFEPLLPRQRIEELQAQTAFSLDNLQFLLPN